MNRILIIIIIAMAFCGVELSAKTDSIPGLGIITPTEDLNSPSGWYIPKNMDECIEELDNMISDDIKDSLMNLTFESTYAKYGYLNQWLLNSWKIWDSSVVVKYFNQFGFYEPTEISLGIFHSYWKYLNDLPITIDVKPEYYLLGKNLFLKFSNQEYRYPNNPAIYGQIIHTDSTPQFIYSGNVLKLVDSLYSPILRLLAENGFNPSQSIYYIWWTKVSIFGEDYGNDPDFLTEEEIENNYSGNASYNADYILIIEDDYPGALQTFMRDFNYNDDFYEVLKTKRYFGFHLIRKREVVKFD